MKAWLLALRALSLALGAGVGLSALAALVLDAQSMGGRTAFLALALLGGLLAGSAARAGSGFLMTALPLLALFVPVLVFEARLEQEGRAAGAKLSDSRSKVTLLRELRGQGVTAFPAAFPSYFFDQPLDVGGRPVVPLAGAARVPTVLCQEAEGWARYTSDRFGFNNPDPVWDGTGHVAVLGDSFVHGACLPEEAIFTSLVRQRFPQTVNLGMQDDGPLLMLATLAEYLPQLRPKAVVWSYYDGNDLYRRDGQPPWRGDLAREAAQPFLAAYLRPGHVQGLAQDSGKIDAALRRRLDEDLAISNAEVNLAWHDWPLLIVLRQRLSWQGSLGLLKTRLALGQTGIKALREEERLDGDAQGIGDDLALLRRVLGQAQDRARQSGAKALFLYLPSVESFLRPGASHPLKERVLTIAEECGFRLVDVEEEFRRLGRAEENYAFQAKGGHFSRLGHRRVAEALAAALDMALTPVNTPP